MDMKISTEEKKTLLKLARDTINAHLSDGALPELPPSEGVFGEECGAFVTLHKRG